MAPVSSLKIALVLATPGSTWGGMEKHTADLAEELADRGHEVHVLAHRAYRQRFPETVQFHPLPFQLGRRNPWLRFKVARVIKKIGVHICHAQGNKAASLLGNLHHKDGITLGTIHGTKSSLKEFRRLDGVIAVSKGIHQKLSRPNTKVIFNGIRHTPFSEETALPPPFDSPFALAIGRLEPVKQFDHLINAWVALAPSLPLFILGDGSETEILRRQVQRLGAGERVKLPGYEANPLPWLRKASVYIISSEREGFPYSLIEALKCQCPVLSTPVNGAIDLLPPNSLAASTHPDDLKALLSERLADLEALAREQKDCFARAAEELTLEAMAQQTEAFYYELLSGKSA